MARYATPPATERSGIFDSPSPPPAAGGGEEEDDSPRVIVFVVFKRQAKEVSKALAARGLDCVALHGDMSQKARSTAISSFTSGDARVLVATDVAARGLDIKLVSHVINYSAGMSVEAYVHRVGRCGRAGRAGLAHTFVVKGVDEPIAAPLAKLLERNRQAVPRELVEMARSHSLVERAKAARALATVEGGAGEGDEDEYDEAAERREQQIANRARQLAQHKLKLKKEKEQMTKQSKRAMSSQMLR